VAVREDATRCAEGKPCKPTESTLRAIIAAGLASPDALLRSLAVPGIEDKGRLRALLQDPKGAVRLAAAEELKRRRDAGALEALRRGSIRDGDDPLGGARLAAIDARLALRDPSATAALRAWFRSSDASARALAVSRAAGYRVFRADLAKVARRDPDASVRKGALLALAELGDRKARKKIRRWWDLRTYRTHARLDPERSAPRLRQIATGSISTAEELADRSAAAVALLRRGDPLGRRALHRMLASVRETASGQALLLLQQAGELVQPDDLGAILPFLGSRDAAVRTAAAVTSLLALRALPTSR
jgi:hypothetical protein